MPDNIDKALPLSVLSTIRDWVKSLIPSTYAGSSSAGGNATKANTILYGEVDSTSTATAFTATISGLTELTDGTIIMLKNGVVTSASGFTININNLGAKPCYSNMATGNNITPTAPTRDTTIFNINYTMLFVYSADIVSGGGWICYRGYDANTNTIGYQLRTNSSNLEASDTGYRYRLWFTSADGKKWVPANTSSATDATASRTMNTRPINPFGPIVYNSTNGTVNSGARPAVGTLWQQYTLTIGYSYVVSLTAWDPVYVQCTPQTDGSAVMNAIVKALPTSNDGKIYIYLGIAYSTTAMELRTEHPVFYHDGNGIKVWTGTKIPSKTSDLTNDSGFITGYTETDPTVPSWAKATTKPSYTASEVGALSNLTTLSDLPNDMVYDLGTLTVDTSQTMPMFSLTSQQVSDITAMWNKGLCAVTATVNDISYVAFKQYEFTFNNLTFKAFSGAYVGAYAFAGIRTGTVVIGINQNNFGVIAPIGDLVDDDIQTAFSSYSVNGYTLSSNPVLSASDVGAQPTLVSGTNIKTINNNSILGSGNLNISSLPTVTASDNGKVLTVVNGAWAVASLPVYQGGIRQ